MYSPISLFASATILLSTTIFASPISIIERNASLINWGSTPSGGLTEVQKLNYVLLLESAHFALYSQAVKNYSSWDFVNAGLKDPLFSTVGSIALSTAGNSELISSAITRAGEAVPGGCTFNWGGVEGAFGWALFTEQFEGLLTSTYTALLPTLTTDDDKSLIHSLLQSSTANSATLRAITNLAPTSNYAPLTLGESGTLFRPLVAYCPASNPAIDITTHPTISLSASALSPLKAGETITLRPVQAEPTNDITGAVLPTTADGEALPFTVTPDGKGGWTGLVPAGVQQGLNYVVLQSAVLGAGEAGLVAGPAVMEVVAA